MHCGADEFASDVARKLGVGIERDHVADGLEQRVVAGAYYEARLAVAPQQTVELFQLASLSFPAHPFFFTRVPQTLAMKQVETSFAVVLVQRLDSALGHGQECRVVRRLFRNSVGKVAQQRE